MSGQSTTSSIETEQDAVCSWNRQEDGDIRDSIEIDAFHPGMHVSSIPRICKAIRSEVYIRMTSSGYCSIQPLIPPVKTYEFDLIPLSFNASSYQAAHLGPRPLELEQ